jgi:hypothetical protein
LIGNPSEKLEAGDKWQPRLTIGRSFCMDKLSALDEILCLFLSIKQQL